MNQILTKAEAQREVNILAKLHSPRAYELTARYQQLYPNFSDGLGYGLADHTGDYRVRTDRVRY